MRSCLRGALLLALLAMFAAGCPLYPFATSGCSSEVSCNDGNPCTVDSCDPETGTCRFDPLPAGSDCEDGDLCNGVATCDGAGTCVATDPVEVDDADPCTADSCDSATGAVSHTHIDGCVRTTLDWKLLPTGAAPGARTLHTAVWTGSRMIVWGGKVDPPELVTGTGAIYDPNTDSWTPVSTTGAPSPRHSHSAVWTGDRMLIWGGYGASSYETDGASYDPLSDSWTAISSVAAPGGRTFHSTVWSGSELIVWGGLNNTTAQGDGARYDPASDSWQPLAASPLGLRLKHMAVWTGDRMLVWGGTNTFDWFATGALYDPSADSWSALVADSGLQIRESASAVWSGSEVVVWGGWDGGNYLDDGALYDASGDSWTPMPGTNAPATRARQLTLWTGGGMLVWGGCAGQVCDLYRDDGGLFTPAAGGGSWSPLQGTVAFPGRIEQSGVFTGTEVIVFGGRNESGILGDGARALL